MRKKPEGFRVNEGGERESSRRSGLIRGSATQKDTGIHMSLSLHTHINTP